MEVKKSHKADLERWRPLMYLAGLVVTGLAFFIVMECNVLIDRWEQMQEDIAIDLDLDLKDDRDMIAAAEKEIKKPDEAKSDELNKVDEELDEIPEEQEEPLSAEKPDEEVKQTEEEPPINMNNDDPETLRIVQELPQFPGGMVEFMKWLTKTLQYPSTAVSRKIQGKVIVSFIVETDGKISGIKLENSVNPLLDNEALRVVRLMPQWTPGKDHGETCRTKVAIPIVFEI